MGTPKKYQTQTNHVLPTGNAMLNSNHGAKRFLKGASDICVTFMSENFLNLGGAKEMTRQLRANFSKTVFATTA